MGSILSTDVNGSSASTSATITTVQQPSKKSNSTNTNNNNNTSNKKGNGSGIGIDNYDEDDSDFLPLKSNTKSLETPILLTDDDDDSDDNNNNNNFPNHNFPTPTGEEYDLIDKIAAELPSIIDEESNLQVQDYIQACDNGKGPMVACFSTAEYLSLFLRKHSEASTLYENTCYRPGNDKSSNAVSMDRGRSKAYPPSCFNLAQMRMTGKGNTKFDRKEGYKLFERGCNAGHGGSCHMQAKMLASYPGSLGKGIPYNPKKAASLLEHVCKEHGDSLSCFTLATMLLRGDKISAEADNVTPDEARGIKPIKQRKNENDRTKAENDARLSLDRDPIRAKNLLQLGCEERGHAPSCYNLAVMYTMGDDGIPKDEGKAEMYQNKTEEYVDKFGGFGFGGSMG